MQEESRKFHLLPVFFNPSLLDDLKKSPYKVEMGTDYLGKIRKGNKWVIVFGISPKGFVHFWLGDLKDNLEDKDFDVFFKHYTTPDRMGKHFYRTQILAEFVEADDEN